MSSPVPFFVVCPERVWLTRLFKDALDRPWGLGHRTISDTIRAEMGDSPRIEVGDDYFTIHTGESFQGTSHKLAVYVCNDADGHLFFAPENARASDKERPTRLRCGDTVYQDATDTSTDAMNVSVEHSLLLQALCAYWSPDTTLEGKDEARGLLRTYLDIEDPFRASIASLFLTKHPSLAIDLDIAWPPEKKVAGIWPANPESMSKCIRSAS